MFLIKAILIILNTIFLSGALIALILYVRKTAEIAKISEQSTEDLSKTTIINKKAVELSQKVLLEMQETRKLLNSPLVTAYFERKEISNNNYLFFTVENSGSGVAKNISYSFNPELNGEDEESIQRIITLGKHIDSLPPSYQMMNLLGRMSHYLDVESGDSNDRKFEVTLKFQDAITNEQFEDKLFLDTRIPLGNCKQ